MKQALLITAAATLIFAGPAMAKPGNGHGNSHAYGLEGPVGYGHGGCPPGLAKKAIPCVPPGQAKKLYNIGQRLPLYGYNLFQRAPSTFAPVENIPVTPDYLIGPGDELLIRAWGQIDVDYRATVDRNGRESMV